MSEMSEIEIDGLDQVVVEARGARAPAVLLLAVAGDGDDDGVLADVLLAEPAATS